MLIRCRLMCVCLTGSVCLCMCACTSELHLSVLAVCEVRLGELLQLHGIFWIHALNLVCKHSASSCRKRLHEKNDFIIWNIVLLKYFIFPG